MHIIASKNKWRRHSPHLPRAAGRRRTGGFLLAALVSGPERTRCCAVSPDVRPLRKKLRVPGVLCGQRSRSWVYRHQKRRARYPLRTQSFGCRSCDDTVRRYCEGRCVRRSHPSPRSSSVSRKCVGRSDARSPRVWTPQAVSPERRLPGAQEGAGPWRGGSRSKLPLSRGAIHSAERYAPGRWREFPPARQRAGG